MQITSLSIHNFKSIENLQIENIENALILVGKNNTGKTGILKAVRAALGSYTVSRDDFNEKNQNIEISMTLSLTKQDLEQFHVHGIVSQYKRFDPWKKISAPSFPPLTAGSFPLPASSITARISVTTTACESTTALFHSCFPGCTLLTPSASLPLSRRICCFFRRMSSLSACAPTPACSVPPSCATSASAASA